VWRVAGSGEGNSNPIDLEIRSRMSSSHVVDCMWSWKKGMAGTQVSQLATSNAMGASFQLGAIDFQPVFDEFNGLSALQDGDLFNTLDWVLDENAIL
jgi:hypothetical protein